MMNYENYRDVIPHPFFVLLPIPVWVLTRDRHDNGARDMLHFTPQTKLS